MIKELYMQNENTIQKKKTYTAPAMEVVEFERQVSLLGGSNTIDNAKDCYPNPCIFD